MKKIVAIFGLAFMSFAHANAQSTCGDPNIIKDSYVQNGVLMLRAEITKAELHGNANERIESTAKFVKSKNQEVINLFKCLENKGKIVVTFDVEAFKNKLGELELLEQQTTAHGGKIIPTQEDIQAVNDAIEAMRINRLALAYISNFKTSENASTK